MIDCQTTFNAHRRMHAPGAGVRNTTNPVTITPAKKAPECINNCQDAVSVYPVAGTRDGLLMNTGRTCV